MFDRLSDGFNGVFRKLSGQGTISEKNIVDAMDEVRTATGSARPTRGTAARQQSRSWTGTRAG